MAKKKTTKKIAKNAIKGLSINESDLKDVSYRLRKAITARIHTKLGHGNKGRKIESILGYTTIELMVHLESLFEDGMDWGNYGEWQLDHIKPHVDFAYTSVEDKLFMSCWDINNIQPLWDYDNIRKSSKVFLDSFKSKDGSGLSERESQRLLMQRKRADAKVVEIDYSKVNKRRRAKCRLKLKTFMLTYFKSVFYLPFSKDQLEQIADLELCILYGRLKATAAPRGGGKSSIGKCAIVWALSYGHIKWAVPIESVGPESIETLDDIKSYWEDPEENDYFRDDFPEICDPVRALEGSSRRSEGQTVKDELGRTYRTKIKWSTDRVVLPYVPGLIASGGRITAKAAEKAIRGLAKKANRPDFVLLNDLETDETARSLHMTKKIRENVEKCIMGLAGQDKGIGINMLGTIINKKCLIAQYTDSKKSPIWNGSRYKFFNKWPDNQDMWDQYLYLYEKSTTKAMSYYRKNRKAMDLGAVVSNKHRFIKDKGEDGKQEEISAIQHGFNKIAKMGLPAFQCEYQNDPPEDDSDFALIENEDVAEKLNNIERGLIPSWCKKFTGYVDVHNRVLYWAVMSWGERGVGAVVDYGTWVVNSPEVGSVTKEERPILVDRAILKALEDFWQWEKDTGWPMAGTGEVRHVDRGLVDSGWKPNVVYGFTKGHVDGIWKPTKGHGKGQSTGKYPKKIIRGKMFRNVKSNYYETYLPDKKVWVWMVDADYYKQRVQDGFKLGEVYSPGSISLYGNDAYVHKAFAEQICDEQWDDEHMRFIGPGGKKARNNHWLDCIAGNYAISEILGIKAIQSPTPTTKPKQQRKPTKNYLDNMPGVRL